MFPLRDSIPSATKPYVNWLIIALNVAVFLIEVSLPESELQEFVLRWGAVPATFGIHADQINPELNRFPTLISSVFLHGGWLHLLGNMWFLYIFGDNVENRLGHFRYLLFYLLCGVAASSTQVLLDLPSEVPVIGASGAIGGVMGAYMICFPRAQVLTLFILFIFIRLVWIPAIAFLGLWFLLQVYSAFQQHSVLEGGNAAVAFWAHVGGFASGSVLVILMRKRQRIDSDSFV